MHTRSEAQGRLVPDSLVMNQPAAAAGAPGPSNANNNLDDLLDCSICYSPFERPLQLNCGHSFCSPCVERMSAPQEFRDFDDELGMFGFMHELLERQGAIGLGGAQANEHDERIQQFRAEDANFLRRRRDRREEDRRIFGGDIKCPECRRTTRIPPEGLPINYRLQDMISRLNISKTKAKKDLICEVCKEVIRSIPLSYFTCSAEPCADEPKRLCATCAIRNHNGHPMKETKILSDQDMADAKETVNKNSAVGHNAAEAINGSYARFEETRKTVVTSMTERLAFFETTSTSLNTQNFTSSEDVQAIVTKSDIAAATLKENADKVEEILNEAVQKLTIASQQCSEILETLGFPAKEPYVNLSRVKIEPPDADENDVIIIEREVELLQRPMEREQERELPRDRHVYRQQHLINNLNRRRHDHMARNRARRDRERVERRRMEAALHRHLDRAQNNVRDYTRDIPLEREPGEAPPDPRLPRFEPLIHFLQPARILQRLVAPPLPPPQVEVHVALRPVAEPAEEPVAGPLHPIAIRLPPNNGIVVKTEPEDTPPVTPPRIQLVDAVDLEPLAADREDEDPPRELARRQRSVSLQRNLSPGRYQEEQGRPQDEPGLRRGRRRRIVEPIDPEEIERLVIPLRRIRRPRQPENMEH